MTYHTVWTTRPRLGSTKPQGTPITEEELGQAMLKMARQERTKARMSYEKVATDAEKEKTRASAKTRPAQHVREMGERTEQAILAILRNAPAGRNEIARQLGVSGSTVRRAIDRLTQQGHTIEERRTGNRRLKVLIEGEAEPTTTAGKVVERLRAGPATVAEMSEAFGISTGGIRTGIERARKAGNRIVTKQGGNQRSGKSYWYELEAGQ